MIAADAWGHLPPEGQGESINNLSRRTEPELRWHASPLTRAVATCAGVVLAAALIGARWQLIAFVAPLLGVLCSIGWQRNLHCKNVLGFYAKVGALHRNKTSHHQARSDQQHQ